MNCKLKLHSYRFYWKNFKALPALEPPFKIFYTFVCKNISSCCLKFPGKNCRWIYEKTRASDWRNLSTVPAPKICFFPLLCSFSLQFVFFSEQPFYGNNSTLDSHISTVISHMAAYPYCFQFPQDTTVTPREIKDNINYARFWGVCIMVYVKKPKVNRHYFTLTSMFLQVYKDSVIP